MNSNEIRDKFLKFFEEREHKIIPSSPLIPDDPSVLLTTAGVQQFIPYYSKLDPETTVHPLIGKPIGKNVVSIQKCFRTTDIDEVGDESHLTFFEMLGNFSFGGYFKEEAIKYAHEFITKVMKLPIDYVSVFKGDSEVPADTESEKIWKSLGVKDIREFGREENFWGPTGTDGPCGPTTEIYIKDIEIWNIVFNEFYCNPDKSLKKLKTPGVDTGMGLERLAMVSQNVPTIFETDLFKPIVSLLPSDVPKHIQRVIVDHARAIVFLLADGVKPSNKEAGYILRRLIRRVVLFEHLNRGLFLKTESILMKVMEMHSKTYPSLNGMNNIFEFKAERKKFNKTLNKGLKEFEKRVMSREPLDRFGRIGSFHDQKRLYGSDAFYLYQTFGFPREVMRDLVSEAGGSFDDEGFEFEMEKHRKISRAGLEKKFGGHGLLLDTGELKAADEEEFQKVLRLHTATHILQAALRKVLGREVEQRGSDVNAKRTRFDFSFGRKMTDEEKDKVEKIINDIVGQNLPVQFVELPKEKAEKTGALFFFKQKYPEKVKVYYIGKSLESAVSKEFCGGPHVERTGQIGKIKIKKEESVGAGIRRIKATVE